MEFTRENPSARFVIPDNITVRQQMQYFSEAIISESPVFDRFWVGAKPLITEWECEIFPDYKASIDDVSNPQIANVLIWAGLQVKKHIDSLEEIPKN